MELFIGDEENLLSTFKKDMVKELLKQPSPPQFQIGDEILIPQSNTAGIVTRLGAENELFFETYDRPNGWCTHRTKEKYVIKHKIKKQKRNKQHLKLKKFLEKNNKKQVLLTKNFVYRVGTQERVIPKGQKLFVDEDTRFIENLDQPSMHNFYANQTNAGITPIYSVLDVVRCFSYEGGDYYYIPLHQLKPREWSTKVFEKLQIPNKEKLRTFIEHEADLKKYGMNFHKGKGKSLLLYGDIGTGKTMTAEAISNLLQKPLISVDIEDSSAPYSIREAFNRATEYDGIVFVDEADLLIGNRTGGNVRIDAIQTLLKYLEEFDGVVIFTTNFGNKIDPALENRIDYKIHYTLTMDTREKIWKAMLPKKLKGKFDFKKYKELDLNGRDIQKCILFAAREADKQGCKKVPVELIYKEIEEFLKAKTEFRQEQQTQQYIG